MRRVLAASTAHESHTASRVIPVLTIALAGALLATALPIPTRAQPERSCPEGLVRSGETGSGSLLLETTTPGCFLPAPRVASDIAVDISGPIARTKLTQRFENPADGWIEGVYLFPLPEGAAVDTLKMRVGERLIEGQIKERQEARQIYELAKTMGRKASLVEQERPNVFTNQVANIGPHEAITVQLEYQESLRFDEGRYHLRVPLVVAPRYSPEPTARLVRFNENNSLLNVFDPVPDRERLEAPVVPPELGKINPASLAVRIEAGFPLGEVQSDSHHVVMVRNGDTGASVALGDVEVPTDRDFTLTFAPKPDSAPVVSLLKETVGGSDYLLALVVPPLTPASNESRPREAIFVLDNSGSMGGESIKQAKASLLLALDRLSAKDRFNVIRFDDTLTVLFRNAVDATPENVARAKNFVARIEANGGTEMLPALLAALTDPTPEDKTRLRQVIFLTDGAVGNEAQLFAAIHEKLGRSRLFTVGIGSAPNSYFMGGAARAGRGTYTYIGAVDQVNARMAELFAKLERPVMTELSAIWPAGTQGEAWPDPLPDLYDGQPVVITMKADSALGSLVLSGTRDGTPWQSTIDIARAAGAKGIEKLWARNKIAALDESRVQGADPAEIDRAVLDVALMHHLASRLTSLVAVDVTPSRPDGSPLISGNVPLNLPDGWDFDKVFGERLKAPLQRADAVPPAAPSLQLAVSVSPKASVAPGDAGLVLPQGGTDSTLLLLAGLALLICGAAVAGRKHLGLSIRT